MNTCRFCGKSELDRDYERLVKYGVRHYAHHVCYLDAGKSLDELHAWQVGNFPFRLLQERGLLDYAEKRIAADVSERVHKTE